MFRIWGKCLTLLDAADEFGPCLHFKLHFDLTCLSIGFVLFFSPSELYNTLIYIPLKMGQMFSCLMC